MEESNMQAVKVAGKLVDICISETKVVEAG